MGNDVSGRHNIYICASCRRQYVTRDRDLGTTPFSLRCQEFGTDCPGEAYSAFYPSGAVTLTPSHEFYKPDAIEVRLMKQAQNVAMLDYVRQGGLLFRRIEPDGAAN